MKVPTPTDADRDRFRSPFPADTGVDTKPMLGNLGAFVNGNMFMGLFGSDIGIKLPDDARATLLAQPGTGPFGPDERPMSGYVAIPPEWTSRKAASWIAEALAAAAALPPNAKSRKDEEDEAESSCEEVTMTTVDVQTDTDIGRPVGDRRVAPLSAPSTRTIVVET